MTTKQIKIICECEYNPDSIAEIVVSVDSVQVWSGSPSQTGPVSALPGAADTQFTFDLDVPNLVGWPEPSYDARSFSFTVTNGTFKIVNILNNYNIINNYVGTPPVLESTAGSAGVFEILQISSQPLWNGVADLERYNIDVNYPNGGPGAVLINDGETCVFNVDVQRYNDTLPLA